MIDIFNLKGKTALITGASSGLGWRFAEILSEAGAKVIITARRLGKLETLAEKITKAGGAAIPISMDVSNNEEVNQALTSIVHTEKIDILINNAGIVNNTPIFSNDQDSDFDQILQTNLNGVWYVTKNIVNHMKDNNVHGSIINIASTYGANKLEAGQVAYCASKAAVIQFTKALVGELSPYNIRINSIAPGCFNTPMMPPWLAQEQDIAKIIPLGFVAEPNDLDGAILFLASNKASRYVTGSCITVDGGISWGG